MNHSPGINIMAADFCGFFFFSPDGISTSDSYVISADVDHPMTQQLIAEKLLANYNLEVNRAAV